MAIDGKYGTIRTERGNIAEGEPVFLLRAQDKLAAQAVRHYAMLRRAHGDDAGAAECDRMADQMDAWPVKRMPT